MCSKSGLYPVPNPTPSFWSSEKLQAADDRTITQCPREVDVAIIGAGYAGASIAYHLLCKNHNTRQPSTVILEAREACSGASGRNGGHLKPDPYGKAADILNSHGSQAALEVAEFERSNLDEIAKLITEDEVRCDFVKGGAFEVYMRQEDFNAASRRLDKAKRARIKTAHDAFAIPGEIAETVSGIRGAAGLITYAAARLWPYKLVMYLLSEAIRCGANLQTNAVVHEVSKCRDNAKLWELKTSSGMIKAKQVVYATNAFTASLVPELKNLLVPVRGVCCRIVLPETESLKTVNQSYSIRFNDWEHDYLIPMADGSIILGGARRNYYQHLESWYDNFDDAHIIEFAASHFDGYMQRLFRGWEHSGAYTDSVWSGVMGHSSDGYPFVGELPGRPDQYICAGFNGHGMSQAFLSAKAVAAVIAGNSTVQEMDIPTLFRVSSERFSPSEHRCLLEWKKVDWTTRTTYDNLPLADHAS